MSWMRVIFRMLKCSFLLSAPDGVLKEDRDIYTVWPAFSVVKYSEVNSFNSCTLYFSATLCLLFRTATVRFNQELHSVCK